MKYKEWCRTVSEQRRPETQQLNLMHNSELDPAANNQPPSAKKKKRERKKKEETEAKTERLESAN